MLGLMHQIGVVPERKAQRGTCFPHSFYHYSPTARIEARIRRRPGRQAVGWGLCAKADCARPARPYVGRAPARRRPRRAAGLLPPGGCPVRTLFRPRPGVARAVAVLRLDFPVAGAAIAACSARAVAPAAHARPAAPAAVRLATAPDQF